MFYKRYLDLNSIFNKRLALIRAGAQVYFYFIIINFVIILQFFKCLNMSRLFMLFLNVKLIKMICCMYYFIVFIYYLVWLYILVSLFFKQLFHS